MLRQLLTAIKEEMDSNTILVGDFNTSLTQMDRSSKMKINKETEAVNDTIDQIDLIDIYRTFHPKTADYPFFSRCGLSWRMFCVHLRGKCNLLFLDGMSYKYQLNLCGLLWHLKLVFPY